MRYSSMATTSLSNIICQAEEGGHTSQDFHDSPYWDEIDRHSLATVIVNGGFRYPFDGRNIVFEVN